MSSEPNPNLTAALQGTLDMLNEEQESPLREATPDSVDLLLDRINNHLAAGLPEKITDDELLRVVRLYRAQALRWSQEESAKKEKASAKRTKVSHSEALDLDI